MTERACKLCIYCVPSPTQVNPDGGNCHRFPPTLFRITNANGWHDWWQERPYVRFDDFCGEWTGEERA